MCVLGSLHSLYKLIHSSQTSWTHDPLFIRYAVQCCAWDRWFIHLFFDNDSVFSWHARLPWCPVTVLNISNRPLWWPYFMWVKEFCEDRRSSLELWVSDRGTRSDVFYVCVIWLLYFWITSVLNTCKITMRDYKYQDDFYLMLIISVFYIHWSLAAFQVLVTLNYLSEANIVILLVTLQITFCFRAKGYFCMN